MGEERVREVVSFSFLTCEYHQGGWIEWWSREFTPLVTMGAILALWDAELCVGMSSSNSLSTLRHLSLWGVRSWEGKCSLGTSLSLSFLSSKQWVNNIGCVPHTHTFHCEVPRSCHPQESPEMVFPSWNLKRVFQWRNFAKAFSLSNTLTPEPRALDIKSCFRTSKLRTLILVLQIFI